MGKQSFTSMIEKDIDDNDDELFQIKTNGQEQTDDEEEEEQEDQPSDEEDEDEDGDDESLDQPPKKK